MNNSKTNLGKLAWKHSEIAKDDFKEFLALNSLPMPSEDVTVAVGYVTLRAIQAAFWEHSQQQQTALSTERDNWQDITPEDATADELDLMHIIFGQKPAWLTDAQWRKNMQECAKAIREHVWKTCGLTNELKQTSI